MHQVRQVSLSISRVEDQPLLLSLPGGKTAIRRLQVSLGAFEEHDSFGATSSAAVDVSRQRFGKCPTAGEKVPDRW